MSVDLILFAISSIKLFNFKFEEVILCNEFLHFSLYGIQRNLQIMIDLNKLLILLDSLMKCTLKNLIIKFFLFEESHELFSNWSLLEISMRIIRMF